MEETGSRKDAKVSVEEAKQKQPPPNSSSEPKMTTNNNEKHGAGGGDHDRSKAMIWRGICALLAVLLILAGITALVLWLVYHPHKPRFTVVGAAIYDLNVSSSSMPYMLSTTMQFTIVTRNPNKRVSIYYDRLSALVAYKNDEAMTPLLMLPPLYHDRDSTVALSPVLGSSGLGVPVSPEVGNGLAVDESYGMLSLKIVLIGRLRWKAGAIRTGHYGVHVKCDVLVGFKSGSVGGQVPLLGSSVCQVHV